MSTFHFWGCEC